MSPETSCQRRERGFSLTSLLGAIVISATLVALLFPAFRKAAALTRSSRCLHNLKQISIASAAYSTDHQGAWPSNGVSGVGVYIASLIPYLGDMPARPDPNFTNSPLICPSAKTTSPDGLYRYLGFYTLPINSNGVTRSYGLSYAQNTYAIKSPGGYNITRRTKAEAPSQTMLYMDWEAHYVAAYGLINKSALAERHEGRVNVAYMDGSIRSIPLTNVPTTASQMPNQFWHGIGKTAP